MSIKKISLTVTTVYLIGLLAITFTLVKQRLQPYKIQAETPQASVYVLPDQLNLPSGQQALVDIIVDSHSIPVTSIFADIPFDNKNLKITKIDFRGGPSVQSSKYSNVTDINQKGRITFSRQYNSPIPQGSFLLVSIWFSQQEQSNRFLEFLPEPESIKIFSTKSIQLQPVETSGTSFRWAIPKPTQKIIQANIHDSKNLLPSPIIVKSIEDSSITKIKPNINKGFENYLTVGSESSYISFLKFDLSKYDVKKVFSAQLRLKNSTRPVGTLRISQTTNHWSESTITYAKSPIIGSQISLNTQNISEGWFDTDITDFINQNMGKIVSFALDSPDQGDLSFFSKDNSTDNPYILLQ